MGERCLLYYITDRTQFPGDERERRRALLARIAEAAQCGVDYVQLREKDLGARELEELAREAVQVVGEQRLSGDRAHGTRLLINSRTDVALAVGADGVHLRSEDVSVADVRELIKRVPGARFAVELPQGLRPASFTSVSGSAKAVPSQMSSATAGRGDRFLIAASCHAPTEVAAAGEGGADFAVFGPVFEKQSLPRVWPVGLEGLRQACRSSIPVLALGGVTLDNAIACLKAGAGGIAGIRLFQESKIEEVVRTLGRL